MIQTNVVLNDISTNQVCSLLLSMSASSNVTSKNVSVFKCLAVTVVGYCLCHCAHDVSHCAVQHACEFDRHRFGLTVSGQRSLAEPS